MLSAISVIVIFSKPFKKSSVYENLNWSRRLSVDCFRQRKNKFLLNLSSFNSRLHCFFSAQLYWSNDRKLVFSKYK